MVSTHRLQLTLEQERIMMNPEKKEAYDYTIRDLETSMGCPQCRARQLFGAVKDCSNWYSKGQARACLEILLYDHECGKGKTNKPTNRIISVDEGHGTLNYDRICKTCGGKGTILCDGGFETCINKNCKSHHEHRGRE